MTLTYFEIYANQVFTTLGQLTAICISSIIAVPMASYYGKNQLNWNTYRKVSDSNIALSDQIKDK